MVIDPVGGDLAEPALRSLRWGGRFVTVGYASAPSRGSRSTWCCSRACTCSASSSSTSRPTPPAELERNERELAELLATGRAVPHIGATFALDDVVSALRLVADGQAIGKVVIVTSTDRGTAP